MNHIQGASTIAADPAQGVLQGAGLVQLLVGMIMKQPIEGGFEHEPVEMRHEKRIDRVIAQILARLVDAEHTA